MGHPKDTRTALLKTVKVMKNKERLRNGHRPETGRHDDWMRV